MKITNVLVFGSLSSAAIAATFMPAAAELSDPSLQRVAQSLDQPPDVSSLLNGIQDDDAIGQVLSVDQLSDVSPTDWAYQALSELIQNWNCISGYPDGTFKASGKPPVLNWLRR